MPHGKISLKVFATIASVAAVKLSLAAAHGPQSLPELTGAYAVGRAAFHLADDKGDFTVQAWYPAQSAVQGKPALWVPADQLSHEENGFVGMILKRSTDPSAKDVQNVMTSVVVHAREGVALAGSPKRTRSAPCSPDPARRQSAATVTLLGAVHMSFTDMAVIRAFALPGDGKAFIDTTRAVLGEFFGQYLLGVPSELIEKGSAKYPLAKVERPH